MASVASACVATSRCPFRGPTWRMLDEHPLRDDDAGCVIGWRALDRIQQTLAPVMLRRRKAEVLTQLPERVGG